MKDKQKRQLLWLTLLATIVWAALMTWEVGGYRRQLCTGLPTERGISNPLASPIGALTITTSTEEFTLLIDQCDATDRVLSLKDSHWAQMPGKCPIHRH